MEKIESDILRGLQETVQRSLQDGAYKTLLRILESMKENGEPYITLFSGNGDVTFTSKIFQLCYTEMSAHIENQFPTLSKTQQAWAYVYVAQGSSGILQEWIADGMEEPPEQVADFIKSFPFCRTIEYHRFVDKKSVKHGFHSTFAVRTPISRDNKPK